jgi:signal transduction histidine kinase
MEEVLRDGRWLKIGRDDVLMITSPISVGDQRFGALYLEIDLSQSLGHIHQLDAELQRIAASGFRESVILTVIIAICMCLGGVVIARAVATRLSSPILELASLTKRIGDGDYQARVPWQRSDELGELSESLHQMAETLQETTVSKTELEELILRRTKELGLANAELRRLDQSRRQFIAEVSHELRTPLTAILGEAQVTLRNRHPEAAEYRSALGSIVELSKQLSQLIADLLFITRSQTTVLPLDTKRLALNNLVDSVCVEMNGFFRKYETAVKVEVGDSKVHVKGDELRLRQLLMILLDNAVKFHDGSAPIAVGLRLAKDQAFLTIRNTGCGVTAEELDHVFDPFYRGNQPQRRGTSGSGLGLAVAKRIVEAHKGTIAVTSTPGTDTLVTVQLPIVAALAGRNESWVKERQRA